MTVKETPGVKHRPRVVRYLGTSDVRSILREDWKKVGVDDQDDVVWDASNGFAVPEADLSEGAVLVLSDLHPEFKSTAG